MLRIRRMDELMCRTFLTPPVDSMNSKDETKLSDVISSVLQVSIPPLMEDGDHQGSKTKICCHIKNDSSSLVIEDISFVKVSDFGLEHRSLITIITYSSSLSKLSSSPSSTS